LNPDGTVDTAFSDNLGGGFNNTVFSVAVQTDGKILAGGGFSSVNGVGNNFLVQLNVDGTLDPAFRGSLGTGFSGGGVLFVRIHTDGSIFAGGYFTSVNGIVNNRLVCLNSDGTVNAQFSASLGAGFDGPVASVDVQADGKTIMAGRFASVSGIPSLGLARLY
jgi:hypothetical protein